MTLVRAQRKQTQVHWQLKTPGRAAQQPQAQEQWRLKPHAPPRTSPQRPPSRMVARRPTPSSRAASAASGSPQSSPGSNHGRQAASMLVARPASAEAAKQPPCRCTHCACARLVHTPPPAARVGGAPQLVQTPLPARHVGGAQRRGTSNQRANSDKLEWAASPCKADLGRLAAHRQKRQWHPLAAATAQQGRHLQRAGRQRQQQQLWRQHGCSRTRGVASEACSLARRAADCQYLRRAPHSTTGSRGLGGTARMPPPNFSAAGTPGDAPGVTGGPSGPTSGREAGRRHAVEPDGPSIGGGSRKRTGRRTGAIGYGGLHSASWYKWPRVGSTAYLYRTTLRTVALNPAPPLLHVSSYLSTYLALRQVIARGMSTVPMAAHRTTSSSIPLTLHILLSNAPPDQWLSAIGTTRIARTLLDLTGLRPLQRRNTPSSLEGTSQTCGASSPVPNI